MESDNMDMSAIFDNKLIEEKVQKKDFFNPLEVLGIEYKELAHSDVIAYLFKNRFSGVEGLQVFMDYLHSKDILPRSFHREELERTVVYREFHDMDIFIQISEPNIKMNLIIENKVWAKEGRQQLKKYQDYLQDFHSDYQNFILFLTPDGRDPTSHTEDHGVQVYSIDYNSILRVIEELMKISKGEFLSFCIMMKNHLEANIVTNLEVKKEIAKIWGDPEMRKKLKVVYDNIPNLGDIGELYTKGITDYLKKEYNDEPEIEYYPKSRGKTKEIKIYSKGLKKLGYEICYMLYDYTDKEYYPMFRVCLWRADYNKNKTRYDELAKKLNGKDIFTEYKIIRYWSVWMSVHQIDNNQPDYKFDSVHDYGPLLAREAIEVFKRHLSKIGDLLLKT